MPPIALIKTSLATSSVSDGMLKTRPKVRQSMAMITVKIIAMPLAPRMKCPRRLSQKDLAKKTVPESPKGSRHRR